MTRTPKLEFDVEHLDNGYLIVVHYDAVEYKDSYYQKYFFTTLEEVKECYAEQIQKLS